MFARARFVCTPSTSSSCSTPSARLSRQTLTSRRSLNSLQQKRRHPEVIPQRKREKCTHAALANADIERARGGDFREAAECFVDAFFVNGKSNIDNREIGSLERAQTSDLS